MKQGLNFHLPVEVDIDLSTVEKIEFIFSKYIGSNIIKSAVYPANVKKADNNVLLIPFTREESYDFKGTFYLDTRITLIGTTDQPETEIIKLEMNETMFEEGEQYD